MPQTMIQNSSHANEYPSVLYFAIQKKMALMSTHNSIIAARTKQIRDMNQKRLAVPFKTGDLLYLSSKNISFPKGLACKLLSKFLEPYKILRDYSNSSFQLELPHHLKWWGIHDIFHSSLLWIHNPNNDWLFPGKMDTQIISPVQEDRKSVV